MFDKRIITYKWGNNPTHDEYTSSNGFIIGNYNKSFEGYSKLVKIAKHDFPFLKDIEIECSYVTKSSYNEGFALIRFPLPANTKHVGYNLNSRIDFSY